MVPPRTPSFWATHPERFAWPPRPAKPASGQLAARIRGAFVIDTVWGLLTIGAVLASVAMALLWIIAVRIRDASHVDVAWAILIACAALAYALLADGDVAHRVLAAALASIWGFRLGLYLLFNRVLGKDEDGRYQALREKWGENANRNFLVLPVPGRARRLLSRPMHSCRSTRLPTSESSSGRVRRSGRSGTGVFYL